MLTVEAFPKSRIDAEPRVGLVSVIVPPGWLKLSVESSRRALASETVALVWVKLAVTWLKLKLGTAEAGEELVKLSVALAATTGPVPSPLSVPIVTVSNSMVVPPE